MRQYSSNPKDAPSNAMIAVQRRYQNMMNDPFRQTQFEMFCGVKSTEYFPSLVRAGNGSSKVPPLEIVSDYPSCVVSQKEVLGEKAKTSEITLALRKPAVLQEFLLTLATTGEIQHTDTCRLTLYVGPYADALRPVFHKLVVPTVSAGVQLKYQLPATLWDAYKVQVDSTLGDLGSPDDDGGGSASGTIGLYSRFVRVVLVATNPTIAIDRAELRGRPLVAGPVTVCALGPSATDEALQGYEEAVTKAASKGNFDFNTALNLEVARIDGGVSPMERDGVMVRHNLAWEFDPCRFVYRRDEALEARLLDNTSYTDTCTECKTSENTFVCPECRQRFCRKCGAPAMQAIPEFLLCPPRLVCKTCLPAVQRKREMLAIQQQQEALEYVAAFSPAKLLWPQGVAEYAHEVPDVCPESAWKLRELKDIRRSEADLARFPHACLVRSLPLGAGNGVPAEAVLVRGNKTPWTAPAPGPLSVAIAFMGDALITSLDIGMAVIDDAEGKSGEDDVVVEIKATSTLEGLEDASNYVQTPLSGPLPNLLRGSMIAIRITPKNPEQRLSVERIRVLGKPSPKEELGTDAGEKRKKKKKKSKVLSKKHLISQQKVEEHLNGSAIHKVLDVYFGHGKASVVHGFAITVPETRDLTTFPKLVRASVLHFAQKKKTKTLEPQGRLILGTYIVPKCTKEGAVLVFNFDSPSQGNVLRLDWVANYGSQESILIGKISIF